MSGVIVTPVAFSAFQPRVTGNAEPRANCAGNTANRSISGRSSTRAGTETVLPKPSAISVYVVDMSCGCTCSRPSRGSTGPGSGSLPLARIIAEEALISDHDSTLEPPVGISGGDAPKSTLTCGTYTVNCWCTARPSPVAVSVYRVVCRGLTSMDPSRSTVWTSKP